MGGEKVEKGRVKYGLGYVIMHGSIILRTGWNEKETKSSCKNRQTFATIFMILSLIRMGRTLQSSIVRTISYE